jgi:hypothetical protein
MRGPRGAGSRPQRSCSGCSSSGGSAFQAAGAAPRRPAGAAAHAGAIHPAYHSAGTGSRN